MPRLEVSVTQVLRGQSRKDRDEALSAVEAGHQKRDRDDAKADAEAAKKI